MQSIAFKFTYNTNWLWNYRCSIVRYLQKLYKESDELICDFFQIWLHFAQQDLNTSTNQYYNAKEIYEMTIINIFCRSIQK